MLKMLDLFSGIGGFSLAASWTGEIETVAFCEIDKYCTQVLNKHWPEVPVYLDIKQLRGEDIGAVDIISGGFPCQPFSCAGKQRGKTDNRYLWPEMFRIIREVKPRWVIGENSSGLVNMELEQCFLDLESEGYEVQSFIIPACGVEAPHRRDRVWIVAYLDNYGSHREERNAPKQGSHQSKNRVFVRNDTWPLEPGVGRVVYGIPNRVERIKGLGNAIVPQVAYPIFQGIVDIERSLVYA